MKELDAAVRRVADLARAAAADELSARRRAWRGVASGWRDGSASARTVHSCSGSSQRASSADPTDEMRALDAGASQLDAAVVEAAPTLAVTLLRLSAALRARPAGATGVAGQRSAALP